MDYSTSLSTLVILAIVVLALTVWVPRKTANSMKKVVEHREDRVSTSLHLIDAHSGMQYSDGYVPNLKGAFMQAESNNGDKELVQRIIRVRTLRKQAVRRRQILSLTLLALTVAMIIASFVVHIHIAFALIPATLLVVLVACGVRASAAARAWEQKTAKLLREKNISALQVANETVQLEQKSAIQLKKSDVNSDEVQQENKRVNSHDEVHYEPHFVAAATEDIEDMVQDGAPTDVLDKREIRVALHKTILAKKAALQKEQHNEEVVKSEEQHNAEVVESAVNTSSTEVNSDATAELQQIRPAKNLDVFDMAAPSQDLISFSFGEDRSGQEIAVEEPESLEIKSMKQVAKAQDLEETEADLIKDSDEVDEGAQDEAFRDSENNAQIEAPEQTDDSLGADLEAVLQRRSA
ncbi:MAG: hypothetical protein Q3961_04655 [Bifidobacteriaceae bacterium]|nr:hypothetical protein [Bifidobacteriaceae bacterium]